MRDREVRRPQAVAARKVGVEDFVLRDAVVLQRLPGEILAPRVPERRKSYRNSKQIQRPQQRQYDYDASIVGVSHTGTQNIRPEVTISREVISAEVEKLAARFTISLRLNHG